MRAPFQTRTILLRSEKQRDLAHILIDTVPLDDEKPLEVVIGERHEKRSVLQNRMMWAELDRIARRVAHTTGIGYTASSWHIFFNQEFLPEEYEEGITKRGYVKWEYLPNGNRICIGSTTELTKKGFNEYMEQIHAYVAGLGVEL